METQKKKHARFGAFEFDRRAGELQGPKGGTLLSKQLADLLELLLEQAGDIATYDEIQEKLWPNTDFMEFEVSIRRAASKLRRILQDSAIQSQYIETIPRRGYRIMVRVEWIGAAPSSDEVDAVANAVRSPEVTACVSQITSAIVQNLLLLLALLNTEDHAAMRGQWSSPEVEQSAGNKHGLETIGQQLSALRDLNYIPASCNAENLG
jgi:DNA-binding winged helix-turn-helix (wHTH) protein